MKRNMLTAKSATLERMYVLWTGGIEGFYNPCFGCERSMQVCRLQPSNRMPVPLA